MGVDRLRAAGWTTQIAARPEVAIPSTSSRYSVEGFDLVTRPAQWFQTAKPGTEQAPGGLDSLRPAWALADMLSRAQDKRVRSAWLPDPDDIDLPALGTPAHRDLQAAWRAFGLAPEAMTRSGYAELFELLTRRCF